MSEETGLRIDETTTEEKESGVASTVFRARLVGDPERWIAIKSSPAKRKFSPEPHDILKEINLLSNISHINIIEFVGSKRSGATIELYTPWVPHSLETLLDTPTFSSSVLPLQVKHLVHSSSILGEQSSKEEVFKVITKSIVYQIVRALEYLHGLDEPVAHRDVKPRNVLMHATGCIKLIDFGIAYQESINSASGNLWPETKGNMYNDVATGPFRAPELLFGPETYDACATDLWSLGCTIAHFFTPIRLQRKSYYDEGSDDEGDETRLDEDDKPNPAFLLPKNVDAITFRSAEWMRQPLFEGRQGSIGLAWSIFRLRGTPNVENWPNFDVLPDANKVQFKVVPSRDIRAHLPNLPPNTQSTGSNHKPPEEPAATPLDLVHRLLVYPPEERLKAIDAIAHPWFTTTERKEDVPLILPISRNGYEGCSAQTEWKGMGLEHWLSAAFGLR